MYPSRSETWEKSRYTTSSTENRSSSHQATSQAKDRESAKDFTGQLFRLFGQPGDYFIFTESTAACYVQGLTIAHSRKLSAMLGGSTSTRPGVRKITFKTYDFVDISSDDPNSARRLDSNFASDRDCDSTTTTRLRHRRLRPHRPCRTR
jgi:hypothetical protein